MTKIIISNDQGDIYTVPGTFECENIGGIYHLLDPREIAVTIAYSYFDAEYDIKQEFIDEDINECLSDIHEKIIEEVIQILEDNGREVL